MRLLHARDGPEHLRTKAGGSGVACTARYVGASENFLDALSSVRYCMRSRRKNFLDIGEAVGKNDWQINGGILMSELLWALGAVAAVMLGIIFSTT